MSRLQVSQGIRSQIARILVDYGGATSIKLIDSTKLYLEDEKSDNFENIIIAINKKSENKFIETENAQEIMQFIQKSLNTVQSLQSSQIEKCMLDN